jgi:hypothetical protein
MAQLLSGTRVYGNTSIDSQLIVGNVAPYAATSNTTGSLIVTGGMGITGNLFMSAANNYFTTTTDSSYRLGWTDNYFQRSNLYGGMSVQGAFFSLDTTIYLAANRNFIVRGIISNDTGNNTVLFTGSSPVRLQNTATSISNTTGSLIVGGGIGVTGNIFARGNVTANGDIVVANTLTSNTATIKFNAALNTLDFIIN